MTVRQRQALNLAPVYDLWAWQEKAACKGSDTEQFFLEHGMRGPAKRKLEAKAIKVCNTCPVILQCREWALNVPENYGVWGGLTAEQRARILSKRTLR